MTVLDERAPALGAAPGAAHGAARGAALSSPWALIARAGALDADERAAFEAALPTSAGAPLADRLLLATCQRVEWYGRGPAPELADLVRRWPALVVRTGDDAVAHVLRLAAGLDSAIVGEDQVLHQLRGALRAARERGPLHPEIGRLVETAIAVGRRVRSRSGSSRTIEALALERLGLIGATLPEGRAPRILVVGAGVIGEQVARAAHAAGLEVAVASRDLAHARALATRIDAVRSDGTPREPVAALDLAGAAALAPKVDGLVVALAGPWQLAVPQGAFPPVVDLSAPAAVDPAVRAALGPRWTGIDELMAAARTADAPGDAVFTARAELLVRVAAAEHRRWHAGRSSVPELRRLAARAERRRAADVAALQRRLPGLSPEQRALIEQFSEQLVARLLHEPLARLRVDEDGSVVEASRRVFGP